MPESGDLQRMAVKKNPLLGQVIEDDIVLLYALYFASYASGPFIGLPKYRLYAWTKDDCGSYQGSDITCSLGLITQWTWAAEYGNFRYSLWDICDMYVRSQYKLLLSYHSWIPRHIDLHSGRVSQWWEAPCSAYACFQMHWSSPCVITKTLYNPVVSFSQYMTLSCPWPGCWLLLIVGQILSAT